MKARVISLPSPRRALLSPPAFARSPRLMLPAANQVHGSVRLRAGGAPGAGRIGEGVTHQTNQCQGVDVFIQRRVRAAFWRGGGEGEGRFFARLSGCRLCFNLLLYSSQTNRGTLSCLFMLRFPFSPIAPPPFSAASVEESALWSPSCTTMGLLSLVGYLLATPAFTFQAV